MPREKLLLCALRDTVAAGRWSGRQTIRTGAARCFESFGHRAPLGRPPNCIPCPELSLRRPASSRPNSFQEIKSYSHTDQMTPPHTHHCTLRCTARSSTGFLLDCGAPTSMMHLRTKPGVIPSFLTVLRAEPRCRRTENRFIETRRNETDSYRKWEQGGPWWMCKGAWVKGTKTQVAARPKP